MKNILIDSDVLLDFFYDNPKFGSNSTRILELCELGKVTGYITPVILSNVYYILKKGSTHARVSSKLNRLLAITNVLTMNEKSSLQALNSKFKDFEDAMQNYAAEMNGKVEVVLTRNTKDFKESNLLVMSPDDFLNTRNAISQ